MALLDLLKFVTTGTWGAGLGRPVTAPEADGNIYNLAAAIQNIIDNPVEGVGISNIAVVGRQMTVYMSDASTYGPFDLPVANPRWRGEWVASTPYSAFDIVSVSGSGTYLVAVDHTSVSPFSATESDSTGQFYIQIAPASGGGGVSGTKEIVDTSGDPLTLTAAHANKFINHSMSFSSGATIYVPAGVFAINDEIVVRQADIGQLAIVGYAYAQIDTPIGKTNLTSGYGSIVTIKRGNDNIDGEVFFIYGDLATAP